MRQSPDHVRQGSNPERKGLGIPDPLDYENQNPCKGASRTCPLRQLRANALREIKELWRARSLLYRRRFLRPNTHFSAFSEIYTFRILLAS